MAGTRNRRGRTPAGLVGSDRERRLWTWTLVVVLAVWSTLGLARTLADQLRSRGLLDLAFGVGMLLVLAAVVALALQVRPRGADLGVLLGVVAVAVLLLTRVALPEERTHLVEYGVVAALIHEALLERRRNGRRVPAPAVLAVVFAALLGTVDELLQLAVPSRVFDPADVAVNAVAAVLAVTAKVALTGASRRLR